MRLLADTHCHLQDAKFDADREEVLARALETLEWLVVIGDSMETSRQAVELCRPGVYAAIGFHPYHAADVDDSTLDALEALAAQDGVVAIGEVGLDYYNEFCPRAIQRKALPRQLALAAKLGSPAIIHCRDAEADTLAILAEYRSSLPGCIMHCFGGNAEFARRCIELGCYISFAGNVTYPKAAPLREAAIETPMEWMLIETDAPYLAPQAKRGNRCEPAFIKYTAAFLAELKGVPLETFARQTTGNARRIFQLP